MEMRHPLDRRREIVAVGIGALSLFILAATLTFVPNGYRSDGGGNLCGPVGNLLGGGLLFLFGYPAYLIHLGLAIFSVLLWRDRLPEEMPLRLLGLVGCVVSFAATLGLWIDAESFASMAMPGPGGMVGDYLSWRSEQLFGELGSSILLIGLSAIFTILAAGGLVVAAAERAWEGAQSLAEWMRSPDLFRRPAKKPAKQKPRPKKVKKTEKSKKAKTESEELEEILADQVGPEPEPDEWIEEEPEEEEIGAEVAEEDTAAEEDEEEVEEEHEPAGPLYDDLEEEDAEPDLEEDDEEIEEAKPSKLRSLLKSKKKQGSGEAMPSSTTFESADYTPPALDLLQQEESNEDTRRMDAMIQRKGEILESALRNFKIDARVVNVDRGPVIAMYEIELAAGIKLNRITSLADDLAMALKAPNVRIVAPIPGKSTVGIEVPNDVREEVRLRGLLASAREEHAKMAVPLFLGRDASGRPLIEDLARMPHLMIAGSTGSGKSVCINTIILSILYTRSPAEVKLILVDPKMVELSYFAEIPHLLCPVVTDMRKAPTILEWAVIQMEKRYELFTRAAVRNIASYNNLGEDGLKSRMGEDCFDEGFEPPALTLPYIVIVVDELADLMMVAAKEVENSITRLAQKSRAVGIHIILATQRPSTNVITGLIKANLPTRISFQVASKIDSRVVIDRNGAENLLGSGDMLYLPPRSSKVMRAQGAFVADDEVRSTVKFLRDNTSPEFHRELVQERGAAAQDEEPPWERDVLYVEAARTILESQRGSASLLQRKYGIGYTRASRLIDMMAEQGLVGEYKGSQAREVLLSLEEFDEQIAELETD